MKFSRIFLIGAQGVMGKLLTQRLKDFYCDDHGMLDLVMLDKGDPINIPDGDDKHYNLVIVATPISEIGRTLEKIVAIDPKFTFITEIGSVKGGLWADYQVVMSQMTDSHSFFASTHPMVGPLAKDWDILDWKKKCIIISGETESTDCHKGFMDFWQDLGFVNEIMTSAKRHDEVIGILSHLSHFMIMMYVRHAKKVLTTEELALAGTSFDTFVKMAEGAERLHDIYDANRSLPQLVEGFCKDMSAYESKTSQINWYAPEGAIKKVKKTP